MARYEYQCPKCGMIFETEQPITEDIPPVRSCAACGGQAQKIISLCSFRLKGPGWPGKMIKRGIED